jgi:hypothetical protein
VDAWWFLIGYFLQIIGHDDATDGPLGLGDTSAERLAFEGVKAEAGVDPQIVVSTGKPGYFAIARSHGQNISIVGWAGPLSTPDATKNEALENCRKRGGTDPRIKATVPSGSRTRPAKSPVQC